MSCLVQFNGYPHSKAGHTYATRTVNPPPRDVELTDDEGLTRTVIVLGWATGQTLTFDAALAEQCGRDPASDGADFAQLWVTAENIGYETAEPKPFTIVTSTTTAAAGKGAK